MSKFVRKNSIQATRFALVAFKDSLTTKVCSVDDLTGPKIKCVGATVKVISNGLVQKGTIVTISDNRESLGKQCEYFNVRKYFGLSSRTKSVQGTNVLKKEVMSNKRSSSVADQMTSRSVNKVNSTPLSTKRSVCYNQTLPSPIVDLKDPYKFTNTPSPIGTVNKRIIKSQSSYKQTSVRRSTKFGRRLSQSLITDYFPFVTRKSTGYLELDNTLNIEDEMDALNETNLSDVFEDDTDDRSIIFVNKLDNLFDMLPESLAKHHREEFDDEINTTYSTKSSYIAHTQGICFARDVILNTPSRKSYVMKYLEQQQSPPKLISERINVTANTTDSKTSTTNIPEMHAAQLDITLANNSNLQTSTKINTNLSPSTSPINPTPQLATTRDIYTELTPMELFCSLMWKCNNTKLDINLITKDILQEIKRRSKTPEIFARNLMYRLFTIRELKGCNVYGRGYTDGTRNGHLNPKIVKSIHQLTHRMFPFVKFSWQNCVRWMNKSIKYVTNLIPEKTTQSELDRLDEMIPVLSSTTIQYGDSLMPYSTSPVDVSLIEDTSVLPELDSSLIADHIMLKSHTVHTSSTGKPLLISTTPESWENSLLHLSTKFTTSLEALVDSLLELVTNQDTPESWEDSLLHLTTKSATSPKSLLELVTIRQAPELREDSLLHISTKYMTMPESWKLSMLDNKTIPEIFLPCPESWDTQLSSIFASTSPESWDNSLLQLNSIITSTSPESWDNSLLQLNSIITSTSPESWDDSLLQLSSIITSTSPESWDDSFPRLSSIITSTRPESWDNSLLQLSSIITSTRPESLEDSLLQLSSIITSTSPESWDNSFLQLSSIITSTIPESWDNSLLQLSSILTSTSPESWDNSFLQLSSILTSTSPESWDNSFLPLSSIITSTSPESWDNSLLQLSSIVMLA